MRYHKLDLNLLTALRALLIEKNVTRAGEAVHLTQPAMSGVLARLREYFDDPLIVQVGRRTELTDLARSLLEPVNDILQRIDATIASRPAFNPERSRRHFTLVATEYVSRVLLLGVVQRLLAEAPGVSMTLRQPAASVTEDLEQGDADVVVTLEPYTSSAHPMQALFEDVDLILVDAANPQVGDTISLQQFQALGHVAYRSFKHGLTMFDNWYASRFQRERRIEVIADSFYLVPHLLIGTACITTLPSRIARQFAATLPLRAVEPLFEIPRLVEVLQWPKHRDYDAGNVWLRSCILEATRSLPPLPIGPISDVPALS